MKVTSLIVFILCTALVCFVQSDKPSNTLTELSKPTNLTCCTERGSVIWRLQQLNSDGVSEQICSDQRCNKQGYSIDSRTPGCFNLIINSTSAAAAGLYQCNEVETDTVSGAYLIVFNYSCSDDAFGNSDDLVEGDRVKFHCSMSWNGKWPFEIRWLSEHGIEMRKDVINDLSPFNSSYLEVNVSRPNFPSITVQFGFIKKGITDPNVDKSCPSVNWTSPNRTVKYEPNNIKLSCPVEWCERSLGGTIDCSADGNPIPEFHWLDWNDKKIASGSVLELKSLDIGTHMFKCVATNVIRGRNNEISKTVIVKVNVKHGTGDFCYSLIFYFLIAIVLALVVVAIMWFVRRKIRAKKHAPPTSQQMGQLPEEVVPLPQTEAIPTTKGNSAEGGKPLLKHDEQKDLNVPFSHEVYNHRLHSANSMEEMGSLVSLRFGFQPNDDSDISENEGSDHPGYPTRNHAHPESEVTGGETEDESTC